MNETENTGQHPESENPSSLIPKGQAPLEEPETPQTAAEETARHSPEFEAFLVGFNAQSDLDTKLQMSIDFMEKALAQGGTPHFRSFWEVRRLCLPLFKENISPQIRGQLWNKYSELSKEARRLKEILDEQSAFAVEQIEIAIQAIEKEIANPSEYAQKAEIQLVLPKLLASKAPMYASLQQQLNLLNVQASRINGLRKELIKTEMRVRQKNKFFQRLSLAGDSVFPKRKELIKQISDEFVKDVEIFIKTYFMDGADESLFVLREEIKVLQGLAKQLTLNTSAFTQTRMSLSECWDKLRGEERERKKERAQQKVLFKQNAELVLAQINEVKADIEQHGLAADGQKKIDNIIALMRKTELGRDELTILRAAVSELRQLQHEKVSASEALRLEHENEKQRQKKELYFGLKERVNILFSQHETYDVEKLTADRDALLADIHEAQISKIEKLELEKLLKPLRDVITEKKEKALLNLSADDRQSLDQLKEVLEQRRQRRQEIKDQLDALRKTAGSSSLDFEKAMNLNTQIHEEKERLDKANQGIQEIEKKIATLQSKIK